MQTSLRLFATVPLHSFVLLACIGLLLLSGARVSKSEAEDVDFRRLDGKPNKLETLEKDHNVRVEYEPSDDGVPIVKNLRARVLQPPRDSPQTKDADQKPAPAGRGTFEALKRYSPRRAIVDAPFLKASEVTDQVTDNELVLGVEIKGKARAYPINMLTGQCIHGDLKGEKLPQLIADTMTWKAWLSAHPDTTVLNLSRSSQGYSVEFYKNPQRFSYGFVVNGKHFHATFGTLRKSPVRNLNMEREPLLLAFNPESTAARLFSRRLNDRPDFHRRRQGPDTRRTNRLIVESHAGNCCRWTAQGQTARP